MQFHRDYNYGAEFEVETTQSDGWKHILTWVANEHESSTSVDSP